MILRLRHIIDVELTIFTPDNSPYGLHQPTYKVSDDTYDKYLIETFKKAVNDAYGHTGHLLNSESISNIDLIHIANTLDDFDVVETLDITRIPMKAEYQT